MPRKNRDQIIEGLRQLYEAYVDLRTQLAEQLEIDFDSIEDVRDEELNQNVYQEVKSLLESFIEDESVSTNLLGIMFSDLYEALMEIDPNAVEEDYEEEEKDDDEDYYDDDEDYDDDEEE